MSTACDIVCGADTSIRDDALSLTQPQQLYVSLDSAHCNVHDQLDYRKLCARWLPKHTARRMGLSLMHLTRYANQGERFI
jgi:hypothetical protein